MYQTTVCIPISNWTVSKYF